MARQVPAACSLGESLGPTTAVQISFLGVPWPQIGGKKLIPSDSGPLWKIYPSHFFLKGRIWKKSHFFWLGIWKESLALATNGSHGHFAEVYPRGFSSIALAELQRFTALLWGQWEMFFLHQSFALKTKGCREWDASMWLKHNFFGSLVLARYYLVMLWFQFILRVKILSCMFGRMNSCQRRSRKCQQLRQQHWGEHCSVLAHAEDCFTLAFASFSSSYLLLLTTITTTTTTH